MDEELRSALRRSGVQPKRYFIVTYRLVPEEIRYLSRGGDGDWYFLKNEQLAFRFADREEAYLQARYGRTLGVERTWEQWRDPAA